MILLTQDFSPDESGSNDTKMRQPDQHITKNKIAVQVYTGTA